MRITHVITGLEPGGAEQTLYKLLAGGLSERWATQVISLTGDGAIGAHVQAVRNCYRDFRDMTQVIDQRARKEGDS